MASTQDAASVPTEEQQTLELVLQLLQSFRDGSFGTAFTCGGKLKIPVASNTAQQSPAAFDASGARTCQPVTLRWDPDDKRVLASDCKLEFPLDESDSVTVHNMEEFLHDMDCGTIDHLSQNVLDGIMNNTYRYSTGLIMGPSNFACTFSPYDSGIIDDVARVLLPGFMDQPTSTNQPVYGPHSENIGRELVMRAEPHKLYVHSGPCGPSKAHFDTPQSAEKIGFLVVCLPSVHEGGQLTVRHGGRTTVFDWSMPEVARPEIQWAAFYSDFEHEISPVTSGNRITLTYNLYASAITGTPTVGNRLVDVTKLPLYDVLHKLFLQEDFMPDGGYLGVHTPHAHSHTDGPSRLTLKGAYMVAWETFRALSCDVRLRPVIELPGWPNYGPEVFHSCSSEDRTDTSSEGSHSHTDDKALDIPPSESGHQEILPLPDKVDPIQLGGGDLPMGGGDQGFFQVELPMRLVTGYGNSVAEANNMADPRKDDDGDCLMAEGSLVSHAPSDPGSLEVDEEEVQALQKENTEVQSLPNAHFRGAEPACLLLPRSEDDEDEEATTARFEQYGVRTGCLALGNDLSFHSEPNLVEGEVEMTQTLDRWIEQEPQGQERIAQQPTRVRYEDVAWLNHSGMRKEPQISNAVYGNEAEAATMYSTCGIVAYVAPFSTRRALLGNE